MEMGITKLRSRAELPIGFNEKLLSKLVNNWVKFSSWQLNYLKYVPVQCVFN